MQQSIHDYMQINIPSIKDLVPNKVTVYYTDQHDPSKKVAYEGSLVDGNVFWKKIRDCFYNGQIPFDYTAVQGKKVDENVLNFFLFLSLIEGDGFTKNRTLVSYLNMNMPDDDTLMTYLKVKIKDLEALATKSCKDALGDKTEVHVAFDCAWNSIRNARHGFVSLVDVDTNKLVEFRIISRDPDLLPFASDKIIVNPSLGPGLFESVGLKSMIESDIWSKVASFCSDGDVKDNKMLESQESQCLIFKDPNHTVKSAFKKVVDNSRLQKSFRIILANKELNPVQKRKKWLDLRIKYPSDSDADKEARSLINDTADLFLRIQKRHHTNYNESFNAIKARIVPKEDRWVIGFPSRMFVCVFAYNENDWIKKFRHWMNIPDKIYHPICLKHINESEKKPGYDANRRSQPDYKNRHHCVNYINAEVAPEIQELQPHRESRVFNPEAAKAFSDNTSDEEGNLDQQLDQNDNSGSDEKAENRRLGFLAKAVFGTSIAAPEGWQKRTYFFNSLDGDLEHFKAILYQTYSSILRINEETLTAIAYYKNKERVGIMHATISPKVGIGKSKLTACNFAERIQACPPTLPYLFDFYEKDIDGQIEIKPAYKFRPGIKKYKKFDHLTVIVQLITFDPELKSSFLRYLEHVPCSLVAKELERLIKRDKTKNEQVEFLSKAIEQKAGKREQYSIANRNPDPIDTLQKVLDLIDEIELPKEIRQYPPLLHSLFKPPKGPFAIEPDKENKIRLFQNSDMLLINVKKHKFLIDDFAPTNSDKIVYKIQAIIVQKTENKSFAIITYDHDNKIWLFLRDARYSRIQSDDLLNIINNIQEYKLIYLAFRKCSSEVNDT